MTTTPLQVTPSSSSSDAELARRAGGGDSDAFQALYARHAGALLAFVRARVAAQSGDILHDAWLRISDGLETFDGKGFRAWALEITRSVLADRGRRVLTPGADSDGLEPAEAEPGEDDPFAGHREGLARCLESLTRGEMQVVRARLEGIDSAHIAERGKVAVDRVHTLFLQASVKIAGCVEERPQ